MKLQERISEDLKTAMKARDAERVNTLRMVLAQLKDQRIALGKDLSDEEGVAVLMNAAKKRKEAIEIYAKSDRSDLLLKEKNELDIISSYLPAQLSAGEIEGIVVEIIAETGASSLQDLGKVMSQAMARLKGQADGKLVQQIVRNRLAPQ
jgi:uncharacterized protein YqeY